MPLAITEDHRELAKVVRDIAAKYQLLAQARAALSAPPAEFDGTGLSTARGPSWRSSAGAACTSPQTWAAPDSAWPTWPSCSTS
jgi:hypothetical protein